MLYIIYDTSIKYTYHLLWEKINQTATANEGMGDSFIFQFTHIITQMCTHSSLPGTE